MPWRPTGCCTRSCASWRRAPAGPIASRRNGYSCPGRSRAKDHRAAARRAPPTRCARARKPTIARLESRWRELNARHFGGALAAIPIGLSSRMRRRLGELVYDRTTSKPVRIVISRRLLKRHPWREVEETLLHEMVHQWQAETGRQGGPRQPASGGRRSRWGSCRGRWCRQPGVCGSIWAQGGADCWGVGRVGRGGREARIFDGLANLRHCHGERMTTAAATSQFPGVDFYDIDSLLSEEERAVRDTVRAWVDDNLMPVIGDALHRGRVSRSSSFRAWPSWASSAPTCRRSTAAPGSTTSPTA